MHHKELGCSLRLIKLGYGLSIAPAVDNKMQRCPLSGVLIGLLP